MIIKRRERKDGRHAVMQKRKRGERRNTMLKRKKREDRRQDNKDDVREKTEHSKMAKNTKR